MTRNPDILFITEYMKNALYFATVRQGKVLKSTPDIHYFCIDNELIYENYYSDFGPLNLGCVYKYCKALNEKLKLYLNKQHIVHYTSIDPKRKANAAFLIGCYGILYLNMSPKEALKPLTIHGQTYRSFQDATQGDSMYTITLLDCLHAIRKARELGFFDFQDFNYEEYERLDKIQGGDLNWIVPGKFLAFIGPVDYSVSLYHPPEMYIDYFMDNNVKIVIRLNKRMYDGNIFSNAGITHYDLFFPDGSCPPRHILFKFLQISEESDGGIAVHCKAGLGRTGSLIGSYLIKHYRMTAHEAIGWMRICRPGSVIGHQQSWLEQLEPWLIKQGNIYRKRTFQDTEKFPIHEYGVYSYVEKSEKLKPVVFDKSPSPPPPIQRLTRSEITPPIRPQASKVREEKPQGSQNNDEEIFITECDLTSANSSEFSSLTQMKGCVIKNTSIVEQYDDRDQEYLAQKKRSLWKRLLCCEPCDNILWNMAVHFAKITPDSQCCYLLDRIAPNKITSKQKEQYEWRLKSPRGNQNTPLRIPTHPVFLVANKESQALPSGAGSRRGFAAGEPRTTSTTRSISPIPRSPSKTSHINKMQVQRNREKVTEHQHQTPNSRNVNVYPQVLSNRSSMAQGTAAKNFPTRTTLNKTQKEKQLNSTLIITPQSQYRQSTCFQNAERPRPTNTTSTFSTIPRGPTQPLYRRRLGRSPSPSPAASPTRVEQTRATNTIPADNYLQRDSSKSALREALSRLRSVLPARDGSIGAASVGAASLGARRDAPAGMRGAPSVRSDERPLATQGDMLNSIKFQRRYRESINVTTKPHAVLTPMPRPGPLVNHFRTSPYYTDYCEGRDKTTLGTSKALINASRPTSPKGRTRQSQITAQHFF